MCVRCLGIVCVVVDEGNPPDCIDKKDDRLVQASTDIFATNRVTGESVDDPATYLSGLDYTATTGLVNKFPFDTQKQTYQYWDPTLADAVPVTYEGTTDMDGLEVYEFHMLIDGATIEIADGVVVAVRSVLNPDKLTHVPPSSV